MSGRFTGLLASVSALAITSFAAQAGALPSHGHFAFGQGSIAKANQSLTVKQSSTTGIINWNSFSIGRHDGVTFDNGAGATLNRVTGGNLSRIAGALHATGSLYLINNAGVIVSGTGRIVTGGNFAASGGSISNTAFEEGDRSLNAGAGRIINKGSIKSGDAVDLSGSMVRDSGRIRASAVNLEAYRGLSVEGNIEAKTADGNGGTVAMRARTIVIGANGVIDASGSEAGTVSVVARGTTVVAGDLKAQGASKGGFIETSGAHLHVANSAHISTLAVSGNAGTWLIDPKNFTIAASGGDITGAALSKELASTDVEIQSSAGKKSGDGDIFVNDAVDWSSAHTLTLDANHSIHIDNSITISGAGGLALLTNDGGTGGDYSFDSSGFVSYGPTDHGGTLTINGTSFTLLYTMSEIQKINSKLTLNYALATSLDASSQKKWVPLGTDGHGSAIGKGQNGFAGIFEGLGNTISNLTVNTGSSNLAGLFGYSSGTLRDIGVVGGSVSGGTYVGGLLAANEGHVLNSYSTANVFSTGGDVGGLVGVNDLYIVNCYAAGNVTATAADIDSGTGGLVGDNYYIIEDSFATGTTSGNGERTGGLLGFNNATVINSYETGPVRETSGDAGGLVGDNETSGGVINSFSLGTVSGSNVVGALIGENSGTAQDAFWDTQTSGLKVGIGDNENSNHNPVHIKGLATAALQSALPSGFGAPDWAIVVGKSFPYLRWQVPSGSPQVISGNLSGTDNVGVAIGVSVDGDDKTLAAMATGANGYYYELLAPGTITRSGSNVLVYAESSDLQGNTFASDVTDPQLQLNILPGTLVVESDARNSTSMLAEMSAALGANGGSDILFTPAGDFTPGIVLQLDLSAPLFAINSAIDVGDGTVALAAAGGVTEFKHGTVGAAVLKGTSEGAVTLTGSGNTVADLGPFATDGDGDFSLTDDEALTVFGKVDAGESGVISLTTVGADHSLSITGTITGATVNLTTTGEATESKKASIVALNVLNVTAQTGIVLTSSHNNIANIGTDQTTSGPNRIMQ